MTEVESIVRKAKVGRVLLVVVAVAACVLGVYAVAVNVKQGSDITNVHNDVTKIEKTACAKDAFSEGCQDLRAEVERAANRLVTCIPFRKAGYQCPLPNSPLARARGGGASQTGSTGSQQSSPREGGSSGGGGTGKQRGEEGGGSGGGGQGKPPAPVSPPQTLPSGSTSSPGRSGDAAGDPEPPASSSPGTVPSAVEAAGGAVKEAGEGVGGAVEGAGKSVDCALRGGC